MENQEQITMESPKKGAGWGMIIFIFITQLILTLYVFLSYGLSNFGGGEQYLPSNATLPVLITFFLLAFSVKLYIKFKHGENNYGLTGLILSIIPPILIILILL